MKIISNLKRYIEFIKQSFKINFYLLVFVIVIIGFFGVFRLTYLSYRKVIFVNQLKTTLQSAKNKVSFLEIAKYDLLNVGKYLYFINRNIPTKIDLSDYLLSLNPVLIENGFFLSRAVPNLNSNQDEEIKNLEIKITLYGYGDLPKLIKNIEEMKRLTKVESVSFSEIKNRNNIELILKIYSM